MPTIDNAIEGTPDRAASIAADTVPEYMTSVPRLGPLLIPDRTMSGVKSSKASNASLTQSEGFRLSSNQSITIWNINFSTLNGLCIVIA